MGEGKGWEQRKRTRRRLSMLRQRICYLIIPTGETEATYLDHYRITTGPKIKIAKRSGKDPLLAVKFAIRERKRLIKSGDFDPATGDETWIVIDRDANPANPTDRAHFVEAIGLAKKSNIFIALSNDCFELWILLHYQDVTANLHRSLIFDLISKHRGAKYDKAVDLSHELVPRRDQALLRARKLHALAEGVHEADANPCTTIYILIERLMSEPGFKQM